MEKKKYLLVISNHNPKNWDEAQKVGWDKIDFIPFPNILPDKSRIELMNDEVLQICRMIGEFYSRCDEEGAEGFVNLQGDFTLCYLVYISLYGENVNFVFPTTDRVVRENPETGEKLSKFQFVMWR